VTPAEVLAGLPSGLREELIACHNTIRRNYVEQRWEPAELNGGKLAEVVYTILSGALSGSFPASASKPPNMLSACRQLEQFPPDASRVGDRSLRILIPRLLPVLYEIRNNRGVGHVGGDVDPNHADAEAVVAMANWVLAELIRVFHEVGLAEAQEAVEVIVSRVHPLVWSVGEAKRVLNPKIAAKYKVLLLLYSEGSWVEVTLLQSWIEYENSSLFKSRVLRQLHAEKLVEFDSQDNRAVISPKGIYYVEENFL